MVEGMMGETGVPVAQRVFGEGGFWRSNFIQPDRCKNILAIKSGRSVTIEPASKGRGKNSVAAPAGKKPSAPAAGAAAPGK